MHDKRKITLPVYCGLAFAASLLYLASFGPACGLVQHRVVPASFVELMYEPCLWLDFHAPQIIQNSISSGSQLCRVNAGLTILRTKLITQNYPVSDLIDGSNFNASPLFHMITSEIEPTSWDVLRGPGSMRSVASTQSMTVRNSRTIHATIASRLETMRNVKRLKKSVRDTDIIALWRASLPPGSSDYRYWLIQELSSRAIVVVAVIGEPFDVKVWSTAVPQRFKPRPAETQSTKDVATLIDFLNEKPRSELQSGIFLDSSYYHSRGVKPSDLEQLKEYCRSRDVDLFLCHPVGMCFGARHTHITWEVHASNSDYD